MCRFRCDDQKLYDDEYGTFYPIADSVENIELLCFRLNELHENNAEMKDKLKKIKVLWERQYDNIQRQYDDLYDMGLVLDHLKI